VGLALDVLRSLGAEIDEHFEGKGAPLTEEEAAEQAGVSQEAGLAQEAAQSVASGKGTA